MFEKQCLTFLCSFSYDQINLLCFLQAAESLFERDGDFLVRDSVSAPGDFVLSCFWKNSPQHFKIIKVVLRPKKGYSRELFQFEDDRFDNIPALIRFYVGGRRPISHASGAIIFHPINRTLPLRVIGERQTELKNNSSTEGRGGENQSGSSKRCSLSSSQKGTLQVINPLLRSGSQPANLENVGRRPSLQSAQSDSNLRTVSTAQHFKQPTFLEVRTKFSSLV
ncbi:hypothetical protein AMECASPLE_034312 [Ameca splendens]|uniref:SH2 domain-containing protein n=1 Tax=Ameca splendens TaxID=208324 RepID=A0ABV1ADH9_9TELE